MEVSKSKVWRLAKPETRGAAAPETPLPNLAAALLNNRGILTPEAIEKFLYPDYRRDLHDPFLFKDMEKVTQRIFKAMATNEAIVVYADYDADGVCSAALLTTTLRALGGNIAEVYMPHREKEGYGLNAAAVNHFIASRVDLIITLDCGTTNTEEIMLASQAGIDVIVIDHHHVPEKSPGAFAILNPKTPGELYPFLHLASAGMAFKTAQALLKKYIVSHAEERAKWESFEKWLLDLAAIATVTDLVPLVGENRTLVKYGLLALNKTQRPGLRALVELMGGKLGMLDTYSIAYQIGPRLNAAGRMNHANAAYELLMCEDSTKAIELASALESGNRERQQLTERITAEAREQLQDRDQDRVLVAVGDNWPIGIVGLVASRLLEEYHRPILVVGRTPKGLSGSGRSISAFNIIAALHQNSELFEKFGGHAQACGFTLKNEEALEQLRNVLNDLAGKTLSASDLLPVLNIDASLLLKDVQENLGELIKLFEPFGMANPRPKFIFSGVQLVGLTNVGSTGQHLKLTLSDESGMIRQAIGFNQSLAHESRRLGDRVDVVAEVTANEWNGRREWQLKILDLRPSLPV
ncbi:single-stranded-DNA-specific exonuclease RecJ [Candidatus Uhrbacteria bacterium RIFCSPLOWO2_02_FULL_48_12]|uniref:Single-stranded-DNA-specific exonuclease RecJ n=1 Tax=Candidatus Uhrbacteria bacterium RIFCSPLOWO2_02_FULL_48_12 TaxID=1802407 RepID=A0A1F7VAA0_9BACT|nr:MAG: single-stranded-DNA-specific exonuclease RecJ [Candidatus Uhrbacteria bacterium RIFCSPLOWO2_02_FULL_48_12]